MLDIQLENKICQMYIDGNSSSKIGESLSMNGSRVCQILNENNIEIRRKVTNSTEYIDSKLDKMIELFDKGYKIKDIASELNIGGRVISRRLEKTGRKIRKEHKSKEFLMSKSTEILQLYKEGKSTIEIGKIFDCVSSSIWRVLKENNADINPVKFNFVNEDFFENIDNEINAYCFGFWLADGNVSTKGNVSKMQITDLDILTTIKEKMKYTGDFGITPAYDNRLTSYCLKISSEKLRNDLIKHGCMPNKTFLLKFPQIPENLIRHMVRGYLDGDGSINVYSSVKHRIYNRWTTNFVGTRDFLEPLMEIINKICVSGVYLQKKNKNNDKNTWLLDIKNHHCIPFLNWIYEDSTIKLNRKYQKYLELVEHYKSKGLEIKPGEPDGDYYYNVPKAKFIKR